VLLFDTKGSLRSLGGRSAAAPRALAPAVKDHDMTADPERLTRDLERAMRRYTALGYSGDLRPAQWQALRFFAESPAKLRTVSALAQARASTMGTTSITVSALVARGLLARSTAGRNVGLTVTELGHARLRAADPANRLTAAIAALPEADRAALARTLTHLLGALDADARAAAETAPAKTA
jgi:DNA-binding MarR family transcriptional regulator